MPTVWIDPLPTRVVNNNNNREAIPNPKTMTWMQVVAAVAVALRAIGDVRTVNTGLSVPGSSERATKVMQSFHTWRLAVRAASGVCILRDRRKMVAVRASGTETGCSGRRAVYRGQNWHFRACALSWCTDVVPVNIVFEVCKLRGYVLFVPWFKCLNENKDLLFAQGFACLRDFWNEWKKLSWMTDLNVCFPCNRGKLTVASLLWRLKYLEILPKVLKKVLKF